MKPVWRVKDNGDHECTIDRVVVARMFVNRESFTDRVDYYVIVVYGKAYYDWYHLAPVKKWQAGRKAVAQELGKRAAAQAIKEG